MPMAATDMPTALPLPTTCEPEKTLYKFEKRNLGDFPDSREARDNRTAIGKDYPAELSQEYHSVAVLTFIDYESSGFLLTTSTRDVASRRETLREPGTKTMRAMTSEVVVRIVISSPARTSWADFATRPLSRTKPASQSF